MLVWGSVGFSVIQTLKVPLEMAFGELAMKEGKRNGNYCNGIYRDYFKDTFPRS